METVDKLSKELMMQFSQLIWDCAGFIEWTHK